MTRTVITVIELLAAVCLVKGGHIKILQAVDNFKQANGEQYRFEKLVEYFMADGATPDFQVACMNFINVIVHSAEDLNFRVHLQHEFTLLGLDDFIMVHYTTYRVSYRGWGALGSPPPPHTQNKICLVSYSCMMRWQCPTNFLYC